MDNSSEILFTKFRTKNNYYLYDTNSNEILSVSKVVWAIFDEYLENQSSVESIFQDCNIYSKRELEQAVKDIRDGLTKGYFQACKISKMKFYSNDDDLINNVKRRLPHLCLDVTQKCNFRCKYCPYTYDSERLTKQRDMSWTTALNAITAFQEHSRDAERKCISFWGGEPLINIDLIRRVVEHVESHYKEDGFHYNFTTNASLITKDAAAFLIENNVSLLVSLDGPQHIHDKYRVTKASHGTYRRTVEGLRKIQRQNPVYYKSNVAFNCVFTPKTDLSEVLSFFSTEELVKDQPVRFSFVSGAKDPFFIEYGEYTKGQISYLWEVYTDAAKHGELESRRLIRALFEANLMRIARRCRSRLTGVVPPNGCCVPLLKKMHVDTIGNIHLCERIRKDSPVGNVNGNGIDFAAVEKLFREYAENGVEECKRCWAVRLCQACYKYSIRNNKWCASNRKEDCRRFRDSALVALQQYSTIVETNPQAFEYMKSVKVTAPI